jgi:uncharacterized lipoprotein YmbA
MKSRSLMLVVMLGLAGCHSPTVPDFSYFRLSRGAALPVAAAPLFDHPLVVDVLAADGLYADQAMVYATDATAHELRQYHYQLWIDPPPRLLQRRLIGQLRAAHAAALVTDELPASRPAVHIGGVILRLDRVPRPGGAEAVVALKLRADAPGGSPILEHYYRETAAASDASLPATVQAFGAALDVITAKFYADLARALHGGPDQDGPDHGAG